MGVQARFYSRRHETEQPAGLRDAPRLWLVFLLILVLPWLALSTSDADNNTLDISEEIGVNDFPISDMGPDGSTVLGASDPAVAYNAAFNEYLVVWRGDDDLVNVNENEIFGQYLDAATGAEIGGNDMRLSDMGPDGSSDSNAEYAAVAANSTDNQYVVVWSGDNIEPLAFVDDEFEIWGQRMVAGVLFSDHFETGDCSAWTIVLP